MKMGFFNFETQKEAHRRLCRRLDRESLERIYLHTTSDEHMEAAWEILIEKYRPSKEERDRLTFQAIRNVFDNQRDYKYNNLITRELSKIDSSYSPNS